ncbi:MAG: hypothetical protein AB7R55_15555 [Gemmatimonadales bacterium]
MKPYDKITLVPNRHRVRELRTFRDLVELYFDRAQRDGDDVPLDYEGARDARSRINRMLPRVVQIIRAAEVGASPRAGSVTDPGVPRGRVDVLNRVFSAPYTPGVEQEIFDVIDMALGVYDANRFMALVRTVNPLHYAGMAVGLVTGGPRRLVSGLFGRPNRTELRPADLARLEAVAAQLADSEELIESRFAALQDRQAARQTEISRQLAELAERLDFAERVLAQRPPQQRLEAGKDQEIITPV